MVYGIHAGVDSILTLSHSQFLSQICDPYYHFYKKIGVGRSRSLLLVGHKCTVSAHTVSTGGYTQFTHICLGMDLAVGGAATR
jgi:hypothetical protein